MGFEFREPPQLSPDSGDVLADGDLVLVSIVLTDHTGTRAYWQDVIAVGEGTTG